MEDLLKLLKLHSAGTSAVPTSKYFLEKPLAGIVDQFERHHYCRVCTKYIGSSQSQEEILKCVSCSSSTTVEASLQEGHFLICIPLKDQLKDNLENQGMHDLCFRADDSRRDLIKDICDGTLYQTLKSNSEDDFLSLTFNCDGVPVFQSSNSVFGQYCVVLMRYPLRVEINMYFYVLYGLDPKSQTCCASSNHLLRSVSVFLKLVLSGSILVISH